MHVLREEHGHAAPVRGQAVRFQDAPQASCTVPESFWSDVPDIAWCLHSLGVSEQDQIWKEPRQDVLSSVLPLGPLGFRVLGFRV